MVKPCLSASVIAQEKQEENVLQVFIKTQLQENTWCIINQVLCKIILEAFLPIIEAQFRPLGREGEEQNKREKQRKRDREARRRKEEQEGRKKKDGYQGYLMCFPCWKWNFLLL